MWICNIEKRHGWQGAIVQKFYKHGSEIRGERAEQKEKFGIPMRCMVRVLFLSLSSLLEIGWLI
jgi:hypothetical protein